MRRYIDIDKLPRHGKRGGIVYWRDIENQSTADVRENVHGKWIIWGGMDIPENHGRHKCSECGEFALLRYEKPLRKEVLSDFCPNCGAKMEGVADE